MIEMIESPTKPCRLIQVTHLPIDLEADDNNAEPIPIPTSRSTYHIYTKHPCHSLITPIPDPTKDRRTGPTLAQAIARRAEKKERRAAGLPSTKPDANAFFLHSPYLAFHVPPLALYAGNSKYPTTPAVLIHQGCFWRTYKLQILPRTPDILDPRGVVPLHHNGGDRKALKADETNLKGYRTRTWRLWGETGKSYIHTIKQIRETGEGIDPDTIPSDNKPAKPDEIVTLRWTCPFSLHTRHYHFTFHNIHFTWKGTGTVKSREDLVCSCDSTISSSLRRYL